MANLVNAGLLMNSAALSDLQNLNLRADATTLANLASSSVTSAAAAASAGITPARAEPLTAPTYAKASESYGVMRQIDPMRDHFLNARIGLEALRRIAGEATGSKGRSLLKRVEDYLAKHMSPAEYQALMEQIGVQKDMPTAFLRKEIPKLGSKFRVPVSEFQEGSLDPKLVEVEHNAHSALFSIGAVAADDIRAMEALHLALVKVRRAQQKALADAQADLADVVAGIPPARARLDALNRQRSEVLDDYLVTQRVLAEHWKNVEQAHAERRRIIESHLGLYYVKVRETPVSQTLPDPLDLRFTSADDLVPGCPNRDTPLAEDLLPFMEAVLDIPAADWSVLHDLSHLLPSRVLLEKMVLARRQRLNIRLGNTAAASRAGLDQLLRQNLFLAGEIAARPFQATSMLELQRQAHAILSLEDLLGVPVPLVREPARALHQRLDAAAGCLLSRLKAITPSLRLAWAEAAEADTLAVESPERWPGLDRAEAADFNGIRTLVELVGWWFRQLHAEASGASRSALRNFVRATLLLAAGDDPDEILHGGVLTLPGHFRIGEALRLNLNRTPPPGALLHLMDEQQKVVGVVRVEDHDDKGTLARISSVLDASVLLNTAFKVSGPRR